MSMHQLTVCPSISPYVNTLNISSSPNTLSSPVDHLNYSQHPSSKHSSSAVHRPNLSLVMSHRSIISPPPPPSFRILNPCNPSLISITEVLSLVQLNTQTFTRHVHHYTPSSSIHCLFDWDNSSSNNPSSTHFCVINCLMITH
jgi:hypothetical protein